MTVEMRKTALALAATLCVVGATGWASACGYDGASAAAIAARYPHAVEVAARLLHPSNSQILDRQLVSPTFVNMMGYHRAVHRLQRLREPLERVVLDEHLTSPGFSLLLVEAGLWTRYAPDAEGVRISVHTPRPPADDVLVFTGEAVIEAIGSGRLSADEAFQRGLIVVDGAPQASGQIAALLRAALDMLADGV